MSTPAGVVAGLLGSAASEAAAFAAGLAIGPTLAPEIEFLKNEAWSAVQTRALDPMVAAEIAAENVDQYSAMQQQAAYHGIAGALFADLYGVSLNAPGTGELLAMLRRGTINSGNFTHGLRKAKLEPMWDAGLADLANQKLSAPDIAYMVVRGILRDDGMLGLSLPTSADNLQLPPQLGLDPVAEAALTGWDKQRLQAFVGRSGLAMAPGLAAQARFRGILTQNDYELTIARGDLYPAYAAPVLEVSRQIPTAEQFVEAHLRGWITQAEMYAGTALHGMSQPYTDLEFQIHRRPLTPLQITKALAWGGNFNPTAGEITDPYVASVHQANLGPEWYGLGEALKHTYSVPFWWRSMVQSGDLGATEAETILLRLGNPPAFATATTQHFAGGTGATADPHITKAQNQLWTTAHRSYVGEMIDAATATAAIETAGVAAASAPAVINLWSHERGLIRKQLTPAQVKKAYKDGLYTLAQAETALLARGYDQADATTLLNE
jgi:hypothetical protein